MPIDRELYKLERERADKVADQLRAVLLAVAVSPTKCRPR